MIYFKGPKAPDFHFEKSRPSLKRIASQAYRRKKSGTPDCVFFPFRILRIPFREPRLPQPAFRRPRLRPSFLPSSCQRLFRPALPLGKAAAGFYRITSPAAMSTRRHPVRRIFFLFFPPSAARSAAGSVFRARIRGVGERFYTTHHFTLSTLFFRFPAFFFHPPPLSPPRSRGRLFRIR